MLLSCVGLGVGVCRAVCAAGWVPQHAARGHGLHGEGVWGSGVVSLGIENLHTLFDLSKPLPLLQVAPLLERPLGVALYEWRRSVPKHP